MIVWSCAIFTRCPALPRPDGPARNSIVRASVRSCARHTALAALFLVQTAVAQASSLADPEIQISRNLLYASSLLLLASLAGLIWILQRRLRANMNDLQQVKTMLQHQLENSQLALEAAQAGLWEHIPAEGRETRSPEWFTMLGYANQPEAQTLEFWSNLVHPEDRDRALATFNAYLRDGRGNYESRYRMRASDGSWRWILSKGRIAERDQAGQPKRMIGINLDIQQLQHAKEEAQDSQTLLNALLDQTSQFVGLVNPEGDLLSLNRAAFEWAEALPEELLGKPIWAGAWWPDNREAESILRKMFRLTLAGAQQHKEVLLKSPKGEPVPFDLTTSPFRDKSKRITAIALEARDISDYKKSQEALHKSQEMFARLFQLSPDMVVLIRQKDRTILEANQAFARFTGYTRDEALNRASLEVGILTIGQQFEAFTQIINRDGIVENFESDLRHRDGRMLKISTSAKLLDIDNERCILSITRDITQLQALHEIIIQSEKMLSLGGIAAGIAHEINNPLGIVLQGAQTVALRLQTDFPKNQETASEIGLNITLLDQYLKARKIDMFLQDIQNAAIRAASIIRHMLDFSRRSESRRSVCNIAEIMEKALSLAACDVDLKKRYNFKYIEIIRDFDEELRPIQCTETEIEQVFLNLLRNAAQAMADATPPVAKPCLRITLHNTQDGIRVEIADNGPGIPEPVRRRIFEPFFTTKAPGTGTGLGLSVSYFIITKSHDGQMHVLTPPEGGTIFIIELPSETRDTAPAIRA